jgi:hypothetical protein
MAAKEGRNSQAFPRAFLDTLWFIGENRVALLVVWALAIGTGAAALIGLARRPRRARAGALDGQSGGPPVTLALVLAVTGLHLAMLTVMAKPGLDAYVIYGYPTVSVLVAVLAALLCARAAARWGQRAGGWVGAATIALLIVIYRPDAMRWDAAKVGVWWHDGAAAACSWRFAEGFERETDYGSTPGQGREQHAIERCRSLSEDAQILDCIGGIARELEWRQPGGRVRGNPPPQLTPAERLAYAYEYGTHRKGDRSVCADFLDADLTETCTAAVILECLHYADLYTKLVAGQGVVRPACEVPAPPLEGYWAATRRDLLSRTGGTTPNLTRAWGDDDLRACQSVFDACY